MKDDDALDRAGADKCINPNCEKPNYLWGREQRVNEYCPLCRQRPPAAAANAMDAVAAAAPIQSSAVPITPARVGYSTYTDWARKIDGDLQAIINRMVGSGDYAAATYYKLVLNDHRAEVKKQKSEYRGL